VTPASPTLVSVVTVVYQGARTLQETIDSVLSQDWEALEYIVIDGGSTDGTLDIIRRNAAHITHWQSEPDRGIYDAMNKGIARARGQLIKLLNADDLLTPGSVRRAAEAYDGGARGGVIKSDMELIDEAGRFVKHMDASRSTTPFGGVVHPSWYVDREVYRQHGLYDPNLKICADYDLFLRLHTRGVPFFQVAPPLVRFRTGGASSGLVGLRERYAANRTHLGTPAALRLLARHGAVKLRGSLLRRVLDERAIATLQQRLARAVPRGRR
jgi:glycosyltransferase involved in cell wall biosynthesis